MKFDLTKKPQQLLLALLVIIAGFGISNILSSSKQPEKKIVSEKTREVKTTVVKNSAINSAVKVTGILYAFNKVDIFAEVSGVLLNSKKQFREGTRYYAGEQFLQIDDEVSRMSLQALKGSFMNLLSQIIPDIKLDYPDSADEWEKYLSDFNIDKPISPLPEINDSKLKYFLAGRNILNQYYSIKSQEALLNKYTIEAPFSGIVTESNINPGTLVRVGQKLGEFTNTSLFELEASVSTKEIEYVKVGQAVILKSNDNDADYNGRIVRINDKIDQASQTVKVYISSSDKGLRDGMFMTGEIKISEIQAAFKLDRKLLIDNNKVYLIVDKKLKLEIINVVKIDGDEILVTGLPEGAVVLAENLTEAYEGMTLN